MTAQEVFDDLSTKYGEDFNWNMLQVTNKTFVAELKKEMGETHFLYNEQIYAVAKYKSNDDVFVRDFFIKNLRSCSEKRNAQRIKRSFI